MKIINNQLFRAFYFLCISQFMLLSCQNNPSQTSTKDKQTGPQVLFSTKLNTDTIALNDIWLVKDMDLEKGAIIRAYKISYIHGDSVKYIKSKIPFDTTISNWQTGLIKQMNFDINIQYRVNKSVKDKWIGSKKIIAIYNK